MAPKMTGKRTLLLIDNKTHTHDVFADAVANAIPDNHTFAAFARVRDCYAIHCGVVVAIFGTTDKPAAWQKNEKIPRPDPRWKLGVGGRDAISTSAASDLQCGFVWINRAGANRS